jgi:hypothetical protein
MTDQVAQGDLLFIKVSDDVSGGGQRAESRNGRSVHVIAYGEKTGHAHIVDADTARFFGDRIVVLSPETAIGHEIRPGEDLSHKHGDAILSRGTWKIKRQRAWQMPIPD